MKKMMRNFFAGKIEDTIVITRFLPILYGTIIFCFFIAWVLYPAELNFSIRTHTFSRLGDWLENPRGWIFFSIALVVLGVAEIPLCMYIYRKIDPIKPQIGYFIPLWIGITSIGLIGLGMFADVASVYVFRAITYRAVHNYVTIFAMGGAALTLLNIGIILIIDKIPKWGGQKRIPITIPLGAYILFLGSSIGLGVAQLIRIQKGLPFVDEGTPYFAPWEWVTIAALLTALYLLAYSVSNKSE
jgi:hypothetical protein